VKGRRVLFIFLDGVGIGPDDPDTNPFLRASLPCLRRLLGHDIPTLEAPTCGTETASASPTDALLGVDGIPQSGTGQTALLTGRNGPALFGRHFGPWIPVRLRPLLSKENLLSRAHAEGLRCAFANAYPRRFLQRSWSRRPAGPPLAAHAAGLLGRDEGDLTLGRAVSSEITNSAWRTRLGLMEIPEITPLQAGMNLAEIASSADLTLFAHYGTDTAGHVGEMGTAVRALEKVDTFLEGVLRGLPTSTLLVLSSDHGNVEETTPHHTRNPVLTVLVGPQAPELSRPLRKITDLAPMILNFLNLPPPTLDSPS
jgi:hypothetical protein